MTKHSIYLIFLAGLISFAISFTGAYYWASLPETAPAESEQVSTGSDEKTQPREENKQRPLTAGDWESFLDYEGPRVEMLGIKQNYNEVNFRDRPDASGQIVATPGGGELLVPLDHYQKWFRARLEDGRIGWIHENLVRQLKVPEPVVKEIRENMPSLRLSTRSATPREFFDHTRLIVTSDRVNLRQGPGTQFGQVGRVYRHQVLRLMARRNDWARILTPTEQIAWIHTSLGKLEYAKPASERKQQQAHITELHYGPEIQFRQIPTDSDTVVFQIIDSTDNWQQLELDSGLIGWIEREVLTRKMKS
ncbi:MAG: SH3 domain-containing protein [bacterium]